MGRGEVRKRVCSPFSGRFDRTALCPAKRFLASAGLLVLTVSSRPGMMGWMVRDRTPFSGHGGAMSANGDGERLPASQGLREFARQLWGVVQRSLFRPRPGTLPEV